MSYDVFISHSARDRAVAEAACDAIERAGHLCWIAPRDLGAGEEPAEASFVGISRSKVFLLILSSESAEAKQVVREAERARPTSDDVAKAIVFLASDASSYINGESIEINGGLYYV